MLAAPSPVQSTSAHSPYAGLSGFSPIETKPTVRGEDGRTWVCETCQKAFKRKDSLVRHKQLHTRSNPTRRSPKACQGCMSIKAKCDGLAPCARCEAKGISCEYGAPALSAWRNKLHAQQVEAKRQQKQQQQQSAEPKTVAETSSPIKHEPPVLPPLDALPETTPAPKKASPPRPAPRALSPPPQSPGPSASLPPVPSLSPIPSFFNLLDPYPGAPFKRTHDFLDDEPDPILGFDPLHVNWDAVLFGSSQPASWTCPETPSTEMLPFPPRRASQAHLGSLPGSLALIPGTGLYGAQNLQNLALMDVFQTRVPGGESWFESIMGSTVERPPVLEDGSALRAAGIVGHVRRVVKDLTFEGLLRLQQEASKVQSAQGWDELPEGLFDLSFVNMCIQHYFQIFNNCFPLLHTPTFDCNKVHWLLLAACIGVGSRSLPGTHSNDFARAMNEVVRRGISLHAATDLTNIQFMDSILICCISGTFSGDRRQFEWSRTWREQLILTCRSLNLLTMKPDPPAIDDPEQDLERMWHTWISQEEKIRLSHSLVVFEAMCSVLYDLPSEATTDDMQGYMVTAMNIWSADTATSWALAVARRRVDRISPKIFDVLHDFINFRSLDIDSLQRQSFLLLLGKLLVEREQSGPSSPKPRVCLGEGVSSPTTAYDWHAPDSIFEAFQQAGVFSSFDTTIPEKLKVHYLSLRQNIPLALVRASVGTSSFFTAEQAKTSLLAWGSTQENILKCREAVWHASQIFRLCQSYEQGPPWLLPASFDAALTVWAFCVLCAPSYFSPAGLSGCFSLDSNCGMLDMKRWISSTWLVGSIRGIGALEGPRIKVTVLARAERFLLAWFPGWDSASIMSRALESLRVQEEQEAARLALLINFN